MKKASIIGLMVAAIALAITLPILGCGGTGTGKKVGDVKGQEVSGTFTDDLGRTVKIESTPKRFVSISPACTEILFALGLGNKVFGVTEYCDYPKAAQSKPKIGTFTTPNLEAIVAAKPDLVLATGGLQKELLDEMEKTGITVYAVNPVTFADTVAAIRKMGQITGAVSKASEIADDMLKRAKAIEKKVAEKGVPKNKLPKVFYEIFFENSAWTAGSESVISDLVRLAGGRNIGDLETSDYYEFSMEKLISENPDVYLVGSGSMAKPEDIGKRPGFDKIKAVQDGRIYVVNEDLVYRTGPRLIDGLEKIYKCLNPDNQ